jgi:hypothetical protein
MSQHLITEFINRTYVFKPFNDSKIVNQRIKKYQGSNRKNNISPEKIAQSMLLEKRMINNQNTEENLKNEAEKISEDKYIDITV